MAAQVASQYRKNRVFLVGDAAHRLPPTGGFGMNTGIQDAHNLAWKLAFVINHSLSDKLLDTYYDERAPIAKQNIAWSASNAKLYIEIDKIVQSGDIEQLKTKLPEQQKTLTYSGLDLGFIYHSSIIDSENDQTLSVTTSEYVPTTLPGSRAPHVKLIKDGKTISTLDLFEKDFVLLIGSEGDAWRTAASELSKTLPFTLIVYKVANNGELIDLYNEWHSVYQITLTGAVLVRPDGHVAWRSKSISDNPVAELNRYFTMMLNS